MYYRRSISKILSAVDDALDGVPEEKKWRRFEVSEILFSNRQTMTLMDFST